MWLQKLWLQEWPSGMWKDGISSRVGQAPVCLPLTAKLLELCKGDSALHVVARALFPTMAIDLVEYWVPRKVCERIRGAIAERHSHFQF